MKDAIAQEFIGAGVRITESKNRSNIGIKGEIVDETKNMFAVKTENGIRKILKAGNVFELQIGKNKIRIMGELLQHRPEERIKTRAGK